MFADLHSHILPGVDDGPKTLEDSVNLVKQAISDGTSNVIATPHFYAMQHELDNRIQNVIKQKELLEQRLFSEGVSFEKMLLGFEVRFFKGISKCDSLRKLSLNYSKVLLIELGFDNISADVLNELNELVYQGYTVILAHVERYYKAHGFSLLKRQLKDKVFLTQVNASSLKDGHFKRGTNKLFKENIVDFIASDMHSVEHRPSELTDAFGIIRDKYGVLVKNKLINNANEMFERICTENL